MTDFITTQDALDAARFEKIVQTLSDRIDFFEPNALDQLLLAADEKEDVFFCVGYLARRGAYLDSTLDLLVKTIHPRIDARFNLEFLEECIYDAADKLESLGIYEPTVEDVRRALPRRATVSAEEALPIVVKELQGFKEAANA